MRKLHFFKKTTLLGVIVAVLFVWFLEIYTYIQQAEGAANQPSASADIINFI